uniref:Uncharacterized protein n=1 Tax=Lygus hesperus TaxID=30085 RepID=A0A146KZF9_LYGHE
MWDLQTVTFSRAPRTDYTCSFTPQTRLTVGFSMPCLNIVAPVYIHGLIVYSAPSPKIEKIAQHLQHILVPSMPAAFGRSVNELVLHDVHREYTLPLQSLFTHISTSHTLTLSSDGAVAHCFRVRAGQQNNLKNIENSLFSAADTLYVQALLPLTQTCYHQSLRIDVQVAEWVFGRDGEFRRTWTTVSGTLRISVHPMLQIPKLEPIVGTVVYGSYATLLPQPVTHAEPHVAIPYSVLHVQGVVCSEANASDWVSVGLVNPQSLTVLQQTAVYPVTLHLQSHISPAFFFPLLPCQDPNHCTVRELLHFNTRVNCTLTYTLTTTAGVQTESAVAIYDLVNPFWDLDPSYRVVATTASHQTSIPTGASHTLLLPHPSVHLNFVQISPTASITATF